MLCHPPKGKTRSWKLGQWCNRKRPHPVNKWPPTLADASAPIAELGQEHSFHLFHRLSVCCLKGALPQPAVHTLLKQLAVVAKPATLSKPRPCFQNLDTYFIIIADVVIIAFGMVFCFIHVV